MSLLIWINLIDYCDYCDIFLTHDSINVRKAHNAGWKHRMQVQNYFSALGQDQVQDVLNQIEKAYENRPGSNPFSGAQLQYNSAPTNVRGPPPSFNMPPPSLASIGNLSAPPGLPGNIISLSLQIPC